MQSKDLRAFLAREVLYRCSEHVDISPLRHPIAEATAIILVEFNIGLYSKTGQKKHTIDP
jgi:hypothetical protein